MPLNIHGPSLGIGVAIATASILGAFFVFGLDFTTDLQPTTEKPKKEINEVQLSLFTTNASPILGSKDAPITLVEFGDYQCFYCNRYFHTTKPDIMKNYVETGKVKVIFKDFTIIGQDSINAAHAVHCAQEEGKFWEYHDVLYNNWSGENNGWAAPEHLLEFAIQIGLDKESFNTCMSEARYKSIVQESYNDAQTLGLTGTPGFFIIGPDDSVTKISGAQPYEVFEEIFESKLEK